MLGLRQAILDRSTRYRGLCTLWQLLRRAQATEDLALYVVVFQAWSDMRHQLEVDPVLGSIAAEIFAHSHYWFGRLVVPGLQRHTIAELKDGLTPFGIALSVVDLPREDPSASIEDWIERRPQYDSQAEVPGRGTGSCLRQHPPERRASGTTAAGVTRCLAALLEPSREPFS